MNKLSFGLFGLFILLGNQLGSGFGIALAICIWMILDGMIDTLRKSKRNMEKKKEVN